MKRTLAIAVIGIATITGCARFRTVQTDRQSWVDTNGIPHVRNIETRATATAFAAGKGSLDGWRATQTDKSQGASLKGMAGESDAAALSQAIGEVLMRGLAAYINPASLMLPAPAQAAPQAAPAPSIVKPVSVPVPANTNSPATTPK